jgi:hypothetical protein
LQLVGVALLLISIGTILGPVGVVVVMYRDNLPALVIPPQINDLINGNSDMIPHGDSFNNDNFTSEQDRFLTPVLINKQVDIVARTFTLTVNFTDTFSFDLTLNSITAGIACADHNYLLGNVSVSGPIVIPQGQTAQITISGSWTQEAEIHIITHHLGANSVNVNLIDATIDVNGIIIQQSQPQNIGEISFIL